MLFVSRHVRKHELRMCVHTYVCTYVCVYIRMCVHTYVCIYTSINEWVEGGRGVCVRARVHACVCLVQMHSFTPIIFTMSHFVSHYPS